MIDIGVLRTYKLYNGWSKCKIRKIEGYGAISVNTLDEMCNGILVSIDTEGDTSYLFIADKPLLDKTFPTDEDPYLLHSGYLVMKEHKVDVGLWINKMRKMVLSIPHLRECFM